MKTNVIRYVLATCLLLATLPATAEDIDLFLAAPSSSSQEYPNVLILIDNTSNWAAADQKWPDYPTQGEAELAALATVVNSLASSDVDAPINIGVMFLADQAAGAYVISAMKPMTVANRAALVAILDDFRNHITTPAYKTSSNAGLDTMMFEAFKYFGGYTSVTHANDNVAGGVDSKTGFGPLRRTPLQEFSDPDTFSDADKTRYIPAAGPASNTCGGQNFIILVGNGWLKKESDSPGLLRNVGEDPTKQIYGYATDSDSRDTDEWARFLYRTDVSEALGQQNVVTYTMDVYNKKPSEELRQLLLSAAIVGGGKYFLAKSSAMIVSNFQTILSEIQAVNSVFTSVSLPVSVSNQGAYLNQVYVGMFRPDATKLPRWPGNLKQYKLKMIDNALKLVDADEVVAINANTGFITECARSFWTPNQVDDYWKFNPLGACLGVAAAPNANAAALKDSNFPDGSIVEKGAQGYLLRALPVTATAVPRQVYTCASSLTTCNTSGLTAFATTNTAISQILLDSTNSTPKNTLIEWERGRNNNNEFLVAVPDPDIENNRIRPSVHGDVLHSRPVALNYADPTDPNATPQIVVFYGGNDGILRAVNGNRDTNYGATAFTAGQELWSFVPPEFYTSIKRLRDNNAPIVFSNFGGAASGKPYGIDGTITANPDLPPSSIFAPMRRGGRAVYAFDVSNPTNPSLKWKRGCTSQTGTASCGNDSNGNFTDIGQTWSAPHVIKAGGYQSTASPPKPKPLLVMGGGYDTCEDGDPSSCYDASTTNGDHVYVMDADTGKLLKTFDTARPVVSQVLDVPYPSTDPDYPSLAKWIYVSDMGGNLYRIAGPEVSGTTANEPLGNVTPENWTIRKIAALGCDTPGDVYYGGCGSYWNYRAIRKFMFAPDVVLVGSNPDTYALMIGSGDREKPVKPSALCPDTNPPRGCTPADRYSYGVHNYFFKVIDKPTVTDWLSSERTDNGRCGYNGICLNSLLPITTTDTPTQAQLDSKPKGWYLGLSAHEQVVTSSVTVFGTTTFSTHIPVVPVAGACTANLGTTLVYNIDYVTAASNNGTGSRFETLTGGGLPPSPVAGQVRLDDGTIVPVLFGGDPDSPLQPRQPTAPAGAGQAKGTIYWYIQQ
ncbi:pilus assembly protein [uncultured Thiodictyon sp.]|uniref:pilus assembly protein n=1 Tax=uncultured Thiodictyon sp. TaxID=1846217 RepID=UPI0025D454C5|nr:PilC/PilY family type IV pilus protein [uncultured Thiodictyon sp.]